MNKGKRIGIRKKAEVLFDRVATILEQARGNVVRTVNTNMVVAYWLIGREIVQEVQDGAERAEYGKQVVEDLSARLTERYGKGFSVTNIWYFKQFYLAFQNRLQIPHPVGGEFASIQIPHPLGGELKAGKKSSPIGTEWPQSLSSQLSWSLYRALMRVENLEARDFYEREAVAGGWDMARRSLV
jgi:hypothetical protein